MKKKFEFNVFNPLLIYTWEHRVIVFFLFCFVSFFETNKIQPNLSLFVNWNNPPPPSLYKKINNEIQMKMFIKDNNRIGTTTTRNEKYRGYIWSKWVSEWERDVFCISNFRLISDVLKDFFFEKKESFFIWKIFQKKNSIFFLFVCLFQLEEKRKDDHIGQTTNDVHHWWLLSSFLVM